MRHAMMRQTAHALLDLSSSCSAQAVVGVHHLPPLRACAIAYYHSSGIVGTARHRARLVLARAYPPSGAGWRPWGLSSACP